MAKNEIKTEKKIKLTSQLVDPLITQRNLEILRMNENGYNIVQIGIYFNLSKQRVSKILSRLRKENSEA